MAVADVSFLLQSHLPKRVAPPWWIWWHLTALMLTIAATQLHVKAHLGRSLLPFIVITSCHTEVTLVNATDLSTNIAYLLLLAAVSISSTKQTLALTKATTVNDPFMKHKRPCQFTCKLWRVSDSLLMCRSRIAKHYWLQYNYPCETIDLQTKRA